MSGDGRERKHRFFFRKHKDPVDISEADCNEKDNAEIVCTENECAAARCKKKSILERIAGIKIIWAIFAVVPAVYALFFTKYDNNFTIVWIMASALLLIASMVLCVMALYNLIRKRPMHRVAGLIFMATGLTIFVDHAILMSTGNVIEFTIGFLIMIISLTFTLFSWDLYRGRTDTPQMLKPLSLMIIGFVVIYIVLAILSYFGDSAQIYDFTDCYFSIGLLVISFVMIHNTDVLERKKVSEIELPRTLFLAVTLFLYGLIYILQLNKYSIEDRTTLDDIASIIVTLVGLYFMIYRNVDKMTSTAIMIEALGVYLLLLYFPYLFDSNILSFVFGLIAVLAASITIILCILMYGGDKYNNKRLEVIMLITLAIYLIPILYDIRMNFDVHALLNEHSARILGTIVIAFTYVAMTDKSLQYYSIKERMAYNVKQMNYAICNDSGAYILRSEAYRLFDESSKEPVNERIEYERHIAVTISGSSSVLSIQKWADSDVLKGEFVRDKSKTYVQSMRFDIKEIVTDGDLDTCHSITMYGDDGFFIILLVADPVTGMKTDPAHRFFYWLVGFHGISDKKKKTKY